MKAIHYTKAFACASLAWALGLSLNAETFKATYSIDSVVDYSEMSERLVGPGFASTTEGKKLDAMNDAQIGYFSGLKALIVPDFTNGVVFSTGKLSAGGSITNYSASYAWPDEAVGSGSDDDINSYFKTALSDPAGIVLYLQPRNRTINVPFLLASEEYYLNSAVAAEPTRKSYADNADRFAVFLQPIGDAGSPVTDVNDPMGDNIALLPDGSDIGIPTVNQHMNTGFFVSNVETNDHGALIFPTGKLNLPMEYNGAIAGLTVVADGLDTTKIYKLKIVIADYALTAVNTALFLRDRGITSGADLKIETTATGDLLPPGEVTVTNLVSNVGPSTADGVVVTNYLPLGIGASQVTEVKCDAGTVGDVLVGLGGTNFCVWTIGDDFVSGSNATMTISYGRSASDSGFYTNVATVATSTGDYDESNNGDSCVSHVGDRPDLIITAKDDLSKVYGDVLNLDDLGFVLSVTNSRGETVSGVTGVKVSFSNAMNEVAYPTNGTAAAGVYGIYLEDVELANLDDYRSVIYVPGKLTVDPKAITITAKAASKKYGEELTISGTEFTCSPTLPNDEQISSATIVCEKAEDPMAEVDSYAGAVAIGHPVYGVDTNNYRFSFTAGKLTVDKASLEITAPSTNKVYGTAMTLDPSFCRIAGLVNGDTVAVTLSSDGTPAAAVAKDYDIVPSVTDARILKNYDVYLMNGTLTVGKVKLMIAAKNRTKPYGQNLTFVGRTGFAIVGGKLLAGDSVTNVTFASEGAAAAAGCVDGGYELKISNALGKGLDSGNYDVSYRSGVLQVTKRALKIKAEDASKVYGDTKTVDGRELFSGFTGKEFTIAEGKLYNRDSVDSVSFASPGAAAATTVGTYDITPSAAQGDRLGNYDIAYVNGTLTVGERPITLKAKDLVKQYGETVTTDGKNLFADCGDEFEVTEGSLVNGDVASVTLSSAGAAATAKRLDGGYPIRVDGCTVKSSDGTSDRGANYQVSFETGVLAVEKRPTTVKPVDQIKTYGKKLSFEGIEFAAVTNLVNGDRVVWVKLESDGAAKTADCLAAGEHYPIKASSAGGSGLENYEIAYEDGRLFVAKASLKIKARDDSKFYGDVPQFDGTGFDIVEGELFNGDAIDSVTLVSAAGSPSTAPVSSAGYPIVPSDPTGDGVENYEYVFEAGSLAVVPRPITITADDAEKVYGETLIIEGSKFTVSETLPNGESITNVTIACSEAEDPETKAGGDYSAKVVPSHAVLGKDGFTTNNYAIAFVNGDLKVKNAALTVTALPASKIYGDSLTLDTRNGFSVEGLLNGDTLESVKLTSDGTAVTATVGPYDIVPEVTDETILENYIVTSVNGTLTVNKREISLAAKNRQKQYGQEFTFVLADSYEIKSGELKNGDAITAIDFTCDGAAASAPWKSGGYEIQLGDVSGDGLDNYDIVEKQSGTLTIVRPELVITAKDLEKTYGDTLTPDATKEFTVTGTLYNGDKVSSVTLTCAGFAATADCNGSGYVIVLSNPQGTGIGNYSISTAYGTLTVNPRDITITASDLKKTYGETLTFKGTEFVKPIANLANGNTVTAVTLGSRGAAANAAVGPYDITISGATGANGFKADNYEINYVNGALDVEKRELTITAKDQTKTYGTVFTFTGDEFTAYNLKSWDSVTGVTLASDGAAKGAAVKAGGYPITIQKDSAVGTGLGNYDIKLENGTLTVNKAEITVTADDQSKIYGESKSFNGDEFKVTAGELVEGDEVNSVTLTCAEYASTKAKVGKHKIVPSAATGTGLGNYDVKYVNGTLTVGKYDLEITADPTNKVYGTSIEFTGREFTAFPEELPNGEIVDRVTLGGEKTSATDADVGVHANAVIPSHEVYGANGFDTNNYSITFIPAHLAVSKAELLIEVKDARWRVGDARPANALIDFSASLKGGDTMAEVLGDGDLVYTNVVWKGVEPTGIADEGWYEREIWLDLASITGDRAKNYEITTAPGDLKITMGEPDLKTSITPSLNWNTGYIDLELGITNAGDGPADPGCDYWVELLPGGPADGRVSSVARTYYLFDPTGTMPDGYEYVDLTDAVKAQLRSVGNKDEVFDPGESIKLKAVSVYHWKRWTPSKFIDYERFFVCGSLFNEADTDRDFVVTESEKLAAAPLLGEDSSAYLEVSRLSLLEYYHWQWNADREEWTWMGPSKQPPM